MRGSNDANVEIMIISEAKSLNNCQVAKNYSVTECPKMGETAKMVLKMQTVRENLVAVQKLAASKNAGMCLKDEMTR